MPRNLIWLPGLLAVLTVPCGTALADSDELVITEIMYNSPGVDIEWIELYNRSGSDLDLTGWYVLDEDDGHPRVLLAGTLAAGEILLVIGNSGAFETQYGDSLNTNPNTFFGSWGLNNDADACRVFRADDVLVDQVWYLATDPWPTEAHGQGPSLQLLSMGMDNNLATSWQASGVDWGTPGEVESSVPNRERTWGGIKNLYSGR